MTHTRTTIRQPSTGFSLMELLVVIAIISIIAAILLGGVALVQEGAKESQAQTVLTNLMGNAGTYEVKVGDSVPHQNPISVTALKIIDWGTVKKKNSLDHPSTDPPKLIAPNYDNPDNNGNVTYSDGNDNDYYMRQANLYIERFIWAANQMPDIRNNLPALGGAFADVDNDGFMEVIDPWGNPVAYASSVKHQIQALLPNNGDDDDFLPAHASPFFASAGKDQKWGLPRTRGEFGPGPAGDTDWNNYKATDDYKFAQDNLYSFDLDRSQSHR